MKTIKVANYSHPLSESVLEQIAQNISEKMANFYPDGVEIEEIRVDSQIDMTEPILPQLERLVELYPYGAEFMVPPALCFSAAYIGHCTAFASSAHHEPYPLGLIVLRGEGVPRRFMLAEIVYRW